MTSTGSRQRPLDGIRVLDMTFFLSGPYGTQILGDMGAEVIKLEPLDGDQTRFLPPHFVGQDSAYFLSANRNKKSICIDYKTPQGLALFKRLLAECDVFVENGRPGHLTRYGIDREVLMKANPGLIWCSISGFGQNGPYAARPAYDMIVQALSGGMSMTGEPEGQAVRSAIPLGDIAAGMYAVIGILGALQGRAQSGQGDFVDVSMLDCQIAMLSYQAAYYLHSAKVPGRQGRGHESIPTYRAFTGGDGVDFVVCANTDRMWRAFCAVIGQPGLVTDPLYATKADRNKNREALWKVFESALQSKPAHTWVELLQQAEIPAAMVNTLDGALSDPQVNHRGMVLHLSDGHGHDVRVAGDPLKFAGSEQVHRYPPRLGDDTCKVLGEVLGISADELERLLSQGAVTAGRDSERPSRTPGEKN